MQLVRVAELELKRVREFLPLQFGSWERCLQRFRGAQDEPGKVPKDVCAQECLLPLRLVFCPLWEERHCAN